MLDGCAETFEKGSKRYHVPKLGSHLAALEEEAAYVIREIVAERERPVLLFSGGKDSIVMLHIALAAFRGEKLPMSVMHVDTGHNFDEVIAFRDALVREHDLKLVVASVQKSIDDGRVTEESGPFASRNRLQSVTLLDAIAANKFDAAFGGARRDEDRARAKERVVSVRDDFGSWDPKNQRPEFFDLYNLDVKKGGHLRVFPLSNFTELDVWRYIEARGLAVPRIYFAHEREVFARDGMLYADSPFVTKLPSETPFRTRVRFRTVGDMSCTGAVRSNAADLTEVIAEVESAKVTERGATRADDRATEAAMEDRKREGYF
jgi:sulfate adenylyltransferase subunit 2